MQTLDINHYILTIPKKLFSGNKKEKFANTCFKREREVSFMKLLCGKCQKQVEPNDMYVCYECGAYVCKDCMNAQSDMCPDCSGTMSKLC